MRYKAKIYKLTRSAPGRKAWVCVLASGGVQSFATWPEALGYLNETLPHE